MNLYHYQTGDYVREATIREAIASLETVEGVIDGGFYVEGCIATRERVATLAIEAAAAGDLGTHSLCLRALNGFESARRECSAIILRAKAEAS